MKRDDPAVLRRYLRQVTDALSQAEQRLARYTEPIAIIGMACRFPGGSDSPEQLWELLANGSDAMGPYATDRDWSLGAAADGSEHQRVGAFVYDALGFDAPFFKVAPREAVAMDPQQRILLESSWAALENARIDPRELRGTDGAVYIGATYQKYGLQAGGLRSDAYYLPTGTASSVLSGRLAYFLGLTGPAITIDTACSASLVALDAACHAMRRGECSTALVGGVCVMNSQETFDELAREWGLSKGGRCRAFAAGADGTGWGEGVGVLVIERLSDAQRNGHRVLAVIRGSAVNQDGASNGLTAPNGPSQERVIRQALAKAGLTPADVDAVEAHGTGTTLGDPIEAQALLATYGQNRDRPLWLGSLKSNIGHTQAAAGIAGVIKMVMAMRHRVLPRTLHVDAPTPHVDWSSGAVELLTEAREWVPGPGGVRRAGVSSFGISGTNAHVVLEEAPAVEGETVEPSRELVVAPWVLSARTERALADQAARLLDHVGSDAELSAEDVGLSLTARSDFDHRAVVHGDNRDALLDGVRALAHREPGAGVTSGRAGRGDAGPVFVFPGQGVQWLGMAVDLWESAPVFARSMEACQEVLSELLDWSLADVLRGRPGAPSLERVDVVQPALFAVMVSLARLWRSHGVEPAAVIGHSQGEIAAACCAGALSLRDAARVVVLRSRIAAAGLAGRGGMVTVAEPADAVEQRIAAWEPRLSVAAENGPHSAVVSGDRDALGEFVAASDAAGVWARHVPAAYASHSPAVEIMRDNLLQALAGIHAEVASVPIWSTVTKGWLDGTEMSTDYWYDNQRERVEFRHGIDQLLAAGYTAFIEISPHPVLTTAVEDTADHAALDISVLGTLRRNENSPTQFLRSLSTAYCAGITVDWAAAFDGTSARHVDLPTYAFQRERYWLEPHIAPGQTAPTRSDGTWNLIEHQSELADAAGLTAEEHHTWEKIRAILLERRAQQNESQAAQAWSYSVSWTPIEPGPPKALDGDWLLAEVDGSFDSVAGRLVRDAIERAGGKVIPLPLAEFLSRDELAAALTGSTPAGFVFLPPATDRDSISDSAGLPVLLRLVQAVGDAGIDAPIWVVTRGAVSTADTERVANPAQAMLWGFGRIVALEHPERWGGLIDLPADDSANPLRQRLASVLAATSVEDQIAIRTAGVLGRRLVPADRVDPTRPEWSGSGCAVVTGGTDTLGGHAARWLAAHGVEHVAVLSRQGARSPSAAALTADIEATGAGVELVACDIADPAALTGALADLRSRHTVTIVVHAAAPLDDARVDDLTDDRIRRSAAVRAEALRTLDALTEDLDLDAFVLFSSVSAVFGNPGHGSYAPANAFLDAYAQQRRGEGRNVTSIAWGPWAEAGMADTRIGDVAQRHGLPLMNPARACTAMGTALTRHTAALAIADIDWPRFHTAFTATRNSPLLSRWADTVVEPADPAATGMRHEPEEAGPTGRSVGQVVRSALAEVLGRGGNEELSGDEVLIDLGFDSVSAVAFARRLSRALGKDVPTTIVYNFATVAELTQHLHSIRQEGHAAPNADQAVEPSFDETLLRAARNGTISEFLEMSRSLAEIEGSRVTDSRRLTVPTIALRSGKGGTLVCLDPFIGPPSPFHYAQLAQHLGGNVVVLQNPGFRSPSDPSPASTAVLCDALLDQLTDTVDLDDRRVVFLGHSSGGLVAWAFARHLRAVRTDIEVRVILLDTDQLVTRDHTAYFQPDLLSALAEHSAEYDPERRARWPVASSLYAQLSWPTAGISGESLLVRAAAADGAPLTVNRPVGSGWATATHVEEVNASHLGMLRSDVSATAAIISEWLTKTS